RGVDRLVRIAWELKRMDAYKIVFVICGRSVDSADYFNKIKRDINALNIDNYFIFLGHQKEPERMIIMCNTLIRLHRWNNPWGRDIIESLTYGKPVITIGTYDKFIEDGVNGYLFPEFDAEKIAEKIIFLSEHPEVCEKMRKANIEKAKRLFDGPTNASKVAAIYDSLIKS
ncbi:MAG: glycosyltransferase, partial [Thermodesulfobacteriota bacterium]|nr:glycosyltransferase [Thermodesulfobacteriota bacterium]